MGAVGLTVSVPATVTAGIAFPVTVSAVDANGNVVVNQPGQISPATPGLSGTLSLELTPGLGGTVQPTPTDAFIGN